MVLATEMFTSEEADVALELVDIYLNDNNQKDYLLYVVENENNIALGYVCFGPAPSTEGTYDLYWIVVSPEYQNQGIGKQLLKFTEEQIILKGGRLIIIETSSQNKYLPTRQFYLNTDYKVAAQIKDFYRNGDDRVIFVKYLTSTI
jgi:ribosomal protein S18 acetylase RimI-like enzyme